MNSNSTAARAKCNQLAYGLSLYELFGEMSLVAGFSALRFRSRPEAASMGKLFAVLPSQAAPRLLVPLDNRTAAINGLRLYTPYAKTGRLLKMLLVTGLRSGAPLPAPCGIKVGVRERTPLDELVHRLTKDQNAVYALWLGMPGPFSKLTVQVMRSSGEVLGYLKFPMTVEAAERVRNEAAALRNLENSPALRPHIPMLFEAGMWRDTYFLFQSPVRGRSGPKRLNSSHWNFLNTLAEESASDIRGRSLVDRAATEWADIESELPTWKALARAALDRADVSIGRIYVRCGVRHGDFAPWNTRIDDNRLLVFDWESARWDEPILWDYAHFHVQVACLLNASLRTVMRHLNRLGSAVESALVLLYLLRSAAGLISEGHGAGSPALVRRRDLLQAHLEQQLT